MKLKLNQFCGYFKVSHHLWPPFDYSINAFSWSFHNLNIKSDPESLDALEKYADQLQQSIISIPLFLTRTRCDLNIRKNSFTNAQVNSFIMQWCSIHQGIRDTRTISSPICLFGEQVVRWSLIKELNFSGAKTPKVFYTHATKTILKHYGLAEPTLLQRYIVSEPFGLLGKHSQVVLPLEHLYISDKIQCTTALRSIRFNKHRCLSRDRNTFAKEQKIVYLS